MNNSEKLIAISDAVASARRRAHAIELAARSAALKSEGQADLESIAHAAFELGESTDLRRICHATVGLKFGARRAWVACSKAKA